MKHHNTDLEKRINQLTDEQLLKMVEVEFNDYAEETQSVAKAVVENRGGLKALKENIKKAELERGEEQINQLTDEQLIKMVEIEFNDYSEEIQSVAKAIVEKRGGLNALKENVKKAELEQKEKKKKRIRIWTTVSAPVLLLVLIFLFFYSESLNIDISGLPEVAYKGENAAAFQWPAPGQTYYGVVKNFSFDSKTFELRNYRLTNLVITLLLIKAEPVVEKGGPGYLQCEFSDTQDKLFPDIDNDEVPEIKVGPFSTVKFKFKCY